MDDNAVFCVELRMNMDAVTCLHAGYMVQQNGWAATKHAHPFVEIIVVTRGKLAVVLGEREVVVAAGEVLCYAPHLPHGERALNGEVEFYLAAAIRAGADYAPVLADANGRIGVLARWLQEEQVSSYEHRQRNMDLLLRAMLAEMEKLTHHKPQDLLEGMRVYLRDHLAEPHTVDALAGRAKMSKFHFIRAYKRATGRTPMEDLRLLRVEAACDLLLTTDLPLKAVARTTGFCDEYYFSRVFRKYRQVSPGSFRRSYHREKP